MENLKNLDLAVLEKISLFKGLDEKRLSIIQSFCQLAEFKCDRAILRMDNFAEELFFVIEGKVDIKLDQPAINPSDGTIDHSVEAMTIASVHAGETFGWSSMVEPHTYILSVYCSSETSVLGKILAKDLRSIFENDPLIGYVVMKNLAKVISDRCRALQYEVLRHGPWK